MVYAYSYTVVYAYSYTMVYAYSYTMVYATLILWCMLTLTTPAVFFLSVKQEMVHCLQLILCKCAYYWVGVLIIGYVCLLLGKCAYYWVSVLIIG